MKQPQLHGKKGFAFIEWMVAIFVIAILTFIASVAAGDLETIQLNKRVGEAAAAAMISADVG
jgi:prepilin-type N-terminal cleavage/methylation domain-containing protein